MAQRPGKREEDALGREENERTNGKKKEEKERGLLWQSGNYLNGVVDLGELYRFTSYTLAALASYIQRAR